MNMNIQYRKEGEYHKSQKNQSLERISSTYREEHSESYLSSCLSEFTG